jgi:uncharacterized protein
VRGKGGRLLIVFSKNPVAGRVKTRLAASIGDRAALEVYETLRAMTLQAASAAECTKAVFYSDFIPADDLFLRTEGFDAFLQEGNDLGERMHRAFLEGFGLGFDHVVLIGTDCPELSSFLIDQAFGELEIQDAVLGPARDGGFYLVGLNHPMPELFLDRKWSTSGVLNESLGILRKQHAEYALLPALSDIDTIKDLQESGFWDLH